MAYLIYGTPRPDGLLPVAYLGNLDYLDVLEPVDLPPGSVSVEMPQLYQIPEAPPGTEYEVLVNPETLEYVYEPHSYTPELTPEESVAKLQTDLSAANLALVGLMDQVAALARSQEVSHG